MATLARRKIVAPECSLAIVTSLTAHHSGRGVMIQRLGLGDLTPLGHAGPDLVTLVAGLLAMFFVTEA